MKSTTVIIGALVLAITFCGSMYYREQRSIEERQRESAEIRAILTEQLHEAQARKKQLDRELRLAKAKTESERAALAMQFADEDLKILRAPASK